MTGRIVIISGPPGAGKSTVARAMAEQSDSARAVHLHTDDFYASIRKGYLDPWLPEASSQNAVVAEAMAGVAWTYAVGGYEVLPEGVVGPWLLAPWLKLARRPPASHGAAGTIAVEYVVLRPQEEVTVARLLGRRLSFALKDRDVARALWRQFSDLGPYEPHVVDTTDESPGETVARLKTLLTTDRFRLTSGE